MTLIDLNTGALGQKKKRKVYWLNTMHDFQGNPSKSLKAANMR